jgi:CheY-like chemotaxis protein/tetratricopeptide (TPR) repeat protein
MTLAETLSRQLENPTLSHDERAMLRCQIAADFEHRGQYDAACDALAELWQGVGQKPRLEGLSELTTAEILLRVGALSGWSASATQDKEGQAAAKDLISESITRFEALGEITRAASGQSELGFIYWREGAYDEARIIYADAQKKLKEDNDSELQAKILIRRVLVESCDGRYNESLRILTDTAMIFAASTNDVLKGKYHNELGLVLRKLGTAESRPDYTDRAIIEYTAAAHHFEQAGHTGYHASAENNLGFLLYLVGRYQEAHEHLNRARRLFLTIKDKGRIAQVDDARARVLLAESRLKEAERASGNAVEVLSKGGEQGLYAEALTTRGRILAKLGNFAESQATLRRAANIAEQAGAIEDAGRALLALIEEHSHSLTEYSLIETYLHANDLLKETQDAETIARLRSCATRIVSARFTVLQPQRQRSLVEFWANFNLTDRVHAYEARYIKRALIDAQGSVTRAARLLGLLHHATLSAMLSETEGRHKDLAHLRKPREPRRKSIIRDRSTSRTQTKTRSVIILHVEDNTLVADMVKDTLELEEWKVITCADGAIALSQIMSNARYDLMILDNDLPNINGLELVRQARLLKHRKNTPIIMLSASDIEREAWKAGVDAFLKKPKDISQLTALVKRLLKRD